MSTVAPQPGFVSQALPPVQRTGTFTLSGASSRQTSLPSRAHRSRPTLDSESSGSTAVASDSDRSSSDAGSDLGGNTAAPGDEVPTAGNALKIVRFAPQDVEELKYHRTVYYPSDPKKSSIKGMMPLQTDFNREKKLEDWTEVRVGKPYFRDLKRSLLTRTYLYDDVDLRHVEAAAKTLRDHLDTVRDRAPDDTEIVLCKTYTGNEEVIGYYLVSMAKRVVFWLDPLDGENELIDASLVTDFLRFVASQPHLELAVRRQFWTHVELFPAHCALPRAAVRELKDAFNFGLCDGVTSQNSMFPYDVDTIMRLSKSFDSVTADEVNPQGTFIAARLLSTIYRERYMAFWGEPGARLTRSESAFKREGKRGPSSFLKIVSPVFFFMPLLYMREFDELYVDDTVHYHPWRKFIDGLKKDWENSVTPATLLIATNISFLSINSIDGQGGPRRSIAQIISYISTILAAFIYIVCQILQRHHRHHVHGQANDALKYITQRQKRLIGLEAVAIAFSIPTALFLWSMLTFLAAMMAVFFDDTALATRVALGVLFGLISMVLVLLLYLEAEGTARGAFETLRLAGIVFNAVSSWWKAHLPRFKKAPADAAEVDDDQEPTSADSDDPNSNSPCQSWVARCLCRVRGRQTDRKSSASQA